MFKVISDEHRQRIESDDNQIIAIGKKRRDKIKASTGFEPVTSAIPAILYQLSYEAIHWERGQFIEFILP